MTDDPAFMREDENVITPSGNNGGTEMETFKVKAILCNEVGMNEIRFSFLHNFIESDLARYESDKEIIPPRCKDMFFYTRNGTIHWIVGYKMNLIALLCEIFHPALGMDAAAIGDEEENHGL
jgi:hypothetical protein